MTESQVMVPVDVKNYIGNEQIVFSLQSKKAAPGWLNFIIVFKNFISLGLLSLLAYFVLYDAFKSILKVALEFDLKSLLEVSPDKFLYALFFVLSLIKIFDLILKIYNSIMGRSNLGPIYVATKSKFIIYNNKSIWSIDWDRFHPDIKVLPYKKDNLIVLSTDGGPSLKFGKFGSKNKKTPKEIVIFGVDPIYQIDLKIRNLIKA